MSNFGGVNDDSIYSSSPATWSYLKQRTSKNEKEWETDTNDITEDSVDNAEEEEFEEDIVEIREDTSVDFFRPLCVQDGKLRNHHLRALLKVLRHSLETDKELILAHRSRIVLFATEVPFKSIAKSFQELMKEILEAGIELPKPSPGPSSFLSKSIFPLPYEVADGTLKILYKNIFFVAGRLSHLNRVLALHPTFFDKYFQTYNLLMRHTGPLPFAWRNYIAILAAARFQCDYLVKLQEIEFTLNDGDKSWLKGIEFAPQKLKNFMDVIQIICHQPWLIKKEHIASLVKGTDTWSIGELVHAIAIVCTFKALAGITLGCGVLPEIDFEDEDFEEEDEEDEEENEEEEGNVQESIFLDTSKILEMLQEGYELEEDEEKQEDLFVQADTLESETNLQPKELDRYIGNWTMHHKDFDVRSKEYQMFKVQDYHWKEHGFDLFRRFLPGIATPLDEEFEHIYTLTYNKFGKNEGIVDTLPLRRAVWYYVQRVKGMFHDDYDYKEVNSFLNIPTKTYVKKLTCYPELITYQEFVKKGYDFEQDEQVHVALLSVESARQSELLYALHAVYHHVNQR